MDKLLNVLLTLLLRYLMIKPPLQRESATLVCNGGWRERGGVQTKFLTIQEGVRAKLLSGVLPNISSYDAHYAAPPSENNCTVPKG